MVTSMGSPIFEDLGYPVLTGARNHKSLCWVTACAISPDSAFIVSGGFYSDDYRGETVSLVIWDVQLGKERKGLFYQHGHGPIDFIYACAISPDGSMIVSSHNLGRLRIWDVNTGRERANFIADSNSVSACAISPDGTLILSKGSDGTLRLWDTQTLQERDFLHSGVHKLTGCNDFSPDSLMIVSGTADGILQLWNMWTGELEMTWQGHLGSVDACSIGPNGYFVASKGSDGIMIWGLQSLLASN